MGAQGDVLHDVGYTIVIEEDSNLYRSMGYALARVGEVGFDEGEGAVDEFYIVGEVLLFLGLCAEVEDGFEVGGLVEQFADVEQDEEVGDGVEAVFGVLVEQHEGAGLHDGEVGLHKQEGSAGLAAFHIGIVDGSDGLGAAQFFRHIGQVEAHPVVGSFGQKVENRFGEFGFIGDPAHVETLLAHSAVEVGELVLHVFYIFLPDDVGSGAAELDDIFRAEFHNYRRLIFSTRLSWRPPSKSVLKKVSTRSKAVSGRMKRAGMTRTLALLCWRARAAISRSQQRAARTLACLLAVMATPLPVPQIRIARAAGSFDTASARGCAKSG